MASAAPTSGGQSTGTADSPSLDRLEDSGIHDDVAKYIKNGSLDHASLLHILQDAAAGGISSSEFSTLKTLDSLLNQKDGITTSSYDAFIADALIGGNTANAHWTGGGSATDLGNLDGSSSEDKANKLIGKWFLGTDLPSFWSNGGTRAYANDTTPLYGEGGAPTYLDVNQGSVGDCYFLAALGDVALREPNAIQSMFTDNGDGTYGVRFFDTGHQNKAVYVTVDSEFVSYTNGYKWSNGSRHTFANGPVKWAALAEKAYAEVNEQGILPRSSGNSYDLISGGWGEAIGEITGKTVTTSSPGTAGAVDAWKNGQEVLVATGSKTSGDFVHNHMYEVIDYDANKSLFELHNPWGSANAHPGVNITFWASATDLSTNGCTLIAASGMAIA